MKLKKLLCAAAAAVIAVSGMTSCSGKKGKNEKSLSDTSSVSDSEKATEKKGKEDIQVETYPDYPVSFPEIEQKDTGDLYEAEKAKFNGDLRVESPEPETPTHAATSDDNDYDSEDTTEAATQAVRKPYSGEGYVTGFKPDGSTSLTFTVDAPSNQHYDLSFSIASKRIVDCLVTVNGAEVSTFKTMNDNEFTLITLYGVFLTKGKSEIEIRPENGDIKLDYLRMSNNTSLSQIAYDADDAPSNKDAGEEAKKLLTFFNDNFGKFVITGQYASDEENKELELIYQTTGKYPVIRFSAIHNANASFDNTFKDIDACADWYRKGGIVGLMWFWEAPSKKPSVYAKDTDFDITKAVTDQKIAELTQEELRGLYAEKKISKECYGIMLDIDNMAGQLTSLKNKGIPVLWRPLHEGYGDWFWWGAGGEDAYKWLWQLMYDRFTKYFELDNLIWVWNGQSESTLVDKKTFDIASVDIYMGSDKEYGSRYEQFLALQKIVGKNKIIGLSECSTIPDIDEAYRDNSLWSFFGLWYGKYLCDENGELSEEFTSKDKLVRAYNSDGAITLDEYKKIMDGEELKPAVTTVATKKPAETTTTAVETGAEEAVQDTETEAVAE
ncbi:glycosyl hydrolase [Ruminococcus sp. XPD3002]|uniref:glycosyl hydrolase n=1 Tax=Ruminococcus sp. XPD3002 TaxID=1452269 RepID=UPI00090FF1E5|nr:mannan endo-1,4-beta-mannosidase [Ruminococcus flavefaciens]